MYSATGINGPVEPILYPIHRGILQFTGFTVLEPYIVYAPSRSSAEERLECLRRYRQRVLELG